MQASGLHTTFYYSLTLPFHRNTGINLRSYNVQRLLYVCIFMCKTVSITWLVSWFRDWSNMVSYMQTKQLLECRDGNTFSFPPFFHISFLSIWNVHPIITYPFTHPSTYYIIAMLSLKPMFAVRTWKHTHTHTHTCSSFYNYSYILLVLEWSID